MYNNGYDNNGYNDYSNDFNNQYNGPYNGQYNQYNNGNTAAYYQNTYVKRDEISPQTYNLIIGATLLYGFIINLIMISACGDFAMSMNPIAFLIAYFVMAISGGLMVRKSDNPVVSFIGYNLIVVPLGLCLTIIINAYLSAGYESIILTAFLITTVVTLVMMALGAMFPTFFLSIGRTLAISCLITIVAELILFFIGIELGIIDYIVVLIFCGYVGYDWAKANTQVKTVDNAIDSACELYIDIVNLFIRILSILSRAND
ncbi:MAG: US12 family protein [Lachnospiraceae bacterium]|nr:US12 family protein [Lachnospiraceae bacterium]MBQ8165542.1 US12 family protein [Lachnospiraceae bacterium]